MLGQSYDIIFLKSVNVFSILLKMAHLLLVWKSSWKCGNGSGLRHKDVDNKGNVRTQRFPYKTPSKPKQTKDGWTQGTPPHSDDPWVAFFSNVGLAGWMTEWLTDWMTEALTDWLAGWPGWPLPLFTFIASATILIFLMDIDPAVVVAAAATATTTKTKLAGKKDNRLLYCACDSIKVNSWTLLCAPHRSAPAPHRFSLLFSCFLSCCVLLLMRKSRGRRRGKVGCSADTQTRPDTSTITHLGTERNYTLLYVKYICGKAKQVTNVMCP